MPVATLTSKGQTTVPREIREHLKLEAGDQLHFTLLASGTVIMRAKKRSLRALGGMLKVPERKPVPVERMNEVIAEAAVRRARVPVRRRRAVKRQ